jgi:hypothetical protein
MKLQLVVVLLVFKARDVQHVADVRDNRNICFGESYLKLSNVEGKVVSGIVLFNCSL